MKKTTIIDYAIVAEKSFRKIGYRNESLIYWCIREAYSAWFITSGSEFFAYAKALYDAQKWADKLSGKNTEPDEEETITKPIKL